MKRPKSNLSDQQRRVFAILVDAAETGARCPTSVEIADRLRTSPSYIDSVFTALHTRRFISVEGTVKGRIVTITETGKRTADIKAMPHWSNPATARVDIMPKRPVEPGRYLLDTEGRLQPMRYAKFVRAVAIVTVKAREQKSLEKPVERVDPAPAPPQPEIAVIAPERRPDPILRPMARKAKPTPVRVPIEELVADDDDEYAEFQRRLAAKRAERAKVIAPKTKVDGIRLAAALRQREAKPAPAPAKRPTKYAQDGGPCRFCGVRGSIGCEHFLPYERGAA